MAEGGRKTSKLNLYALEGKNNVEPRFVEYGKQAKGGGRPQANESSKLQPQPQPQPQPPHENGERKKKLKGTLICIHVER